MKSSWSADEPFFGFFAIGSALFAGLVVALVPSSISSLAVVGVIGITLGAAVLVWPVLLLHLILWAAASGSVLRNLEIASAGNAQITFSGLRWLGVLVLIFVAFGLRRVRFEFPLYLIPFGTLLIWMAFRYAAGTPDARGFRDLIIYGTPLFIALYASGTLRGEPARSLQSLQNLKLSLYASVLLPYGIYAVAIGLGLEEITLHGPKGFVGSRPVASYMLVILALALSCWRYDSKKRSKRLALLVAVLATLLIFFTASRIASGMAVLLMFLVSVRPGRLWQLLPRGVLGVVFVIVVFLSVPSLSQRMFYSVPTSINDARELVNLSGRDVMWEIVFERARERPWIGWGPGTVRPIIADTLPWSQRDVPPTEYPPHNEYLEIFHDLGGIGLALLIFAWGAILVHHTRAWHRAHFADDKVLAAWSLASVFVILVVLVNSFIDNTFHYFVVMAPAFVLLGSSEALARSRLRAGPSSLQEC